MPVLEPTSYETLLINEATKAVMAVFDGASGQYVPTPNRWGSPIFKYDLDETQVSFHSTKKGEHGVEVRFSRDLKKVTVTWTTISGSFATSSADPFSDNTVTRVTSKGFIAAFTKALNDTWAGVDISKVIAKGEKQSWYSTGYSDHTPEQERDCCIHQRAKQALAFRLALAPSGTPVTFEYKGKNILGALHRIKVSNRRAPPGGDPFTITSLEIDANKLRYTISFHNVVSA